MATSSEEISKSNAYAQGKPDANLANDSEHLGGIPAEDWATKEYVHIYHGNKETELKKYIDEQDKSNLEKAKAYADNIVQKQDFSDFAKTADVKALDEKLSKEIEGCGKNCETKMDEKIKAVVEDVNSNFDDVGKSLDQLNKNQKELFQSVSDGKKLVAEAITDKGVKTSATDTFGTMAGNVRKIPTGGGEVDPNFVNTSDGTATEDDIKLGKTAYVKGEKIYGTHTENTEGGINTDDATANTDDIKEGKTAYARGIKLIGSHVDLDTNDATANSSDIKKGMTAYARGIKLTGTHVETGINTDDATATAMDIKKGMTAYVQGRKIEGVHEENPEHDMSDATATPYDILSGKTAYTENGKITGVLEVNESTKIPSYNVDSVEKVYGSVVSTCKQVYYPTINGLGVNSTAGVIRNKEGKIIASVSFYDGTITVCTRISIYLMTQTHKESYTLSNLGIDSKWDEYVYVNVSSFIRNS